MFVAIKKLTPGMHIGLGLARSFGERERLYVFYMFRMWVLYIE